MSVRLWPSVWDAAGVSKPREHAAAVTLSLTHDEAIVLGSAARIGDI